MKKGAGKYNRLVTVLTAKETNDGSGGLQRTLTVVGKAWAHYKGIRGDKQLIAAAETAHAIVDWSIRLPLDFALGMQSVITYAGDEYEVVDPNLGQNFEEIVCRTRLRAGQ